MSNFKKTTRAKKKPVEIYCDGERLGFDSAAACAKNIGVTPGGVASAALRGHLCKGWRIEYV